MVPGEPTPRRGRFYVLDGVDGCGKTTQARRLAALLGEGAAASPLHVREPGTTEVGERLRDILLHVDAPLAPETEALLFAASRRQTLEEVVGPALRAGRDVVCERFHASTFAYQAVAGGLDEDAVLELLHRWANDPAPDLVIVLDLDVDRAESRATERSPKDRIEARGIEFQRRVAEGYRRYAERSANTVIVDANGTEDEVADRVLAEVRRADR